MDDLIAKLKDSAPDLVKENKGALVGAIIGYLLSDNEKAKSAILGALAGAVVGDKNDQE